MPFYLEVSFIPTIPSLILTARGPTAFLSVSKQISREFSWTHKQLYQILLSRSEAPVYNYNPIPILLTAENVIDVKCGEKEREKSFR